MKFNERMFILKIISRIFANFPQLCIIREKPQMNGSCHGDKIVNISVIISRVTNLLLTAHQFTHATGSLA